MTTPTFRYVFGPVPSRRLGRSLGVDLVPFKTCTYDCVYCQLGRTTNKTLERKEYVPLQDIVSELARKLANEPAPDYVTLSGSGEPTLYSRLGDAIREIKRITSVPVAVLTNGSLFWDREVRQSVGQADLVLPSLDAGDERLFQYVNRPHPLVRFDEMVAGLELLRREFSGRIWLEVLLLEGVTGSKAEVQKIARLVERIEPDRVQLNTVVRPPAEEFAQAVPRERLEELAREFAGRGEVVAEFHDVERSTSFLAAEGDVLSLLSRRPCSVEDIANGLRIRPNEAVKHVEQLVSRGLVVSRVKNGRVFYTATERHKRRESGRPDRGAATE